VTYSRIYVSKLYFVVVSVSNSAYIVFDVIKPLAGFTVRDVFESPVPVV
jgi:hypothetical protein